jgi:predicted lipoprotein with Yx(FWY)xxD motif
MDRRAVLSLAFLAALVFTAAGCGGGDSGEASGGADAAASTAAASGTSEREASTTRKRRRGLRIKLLDTPQGKILTGPRGQVLYLFTRERSRRSRCYGACAAAWPPAFTKGRPRAGEGVDSELLGTTRRRDGRRIATYNGHPLYYYAHERPRQVLCQAIEEFGGTWYVVAPSGDAILERFSVS